MHVQQDRVVIEGVSGGDVEGVSFPVDCKDCFFTARGTACIDFTGQPPYDCVDWKTGATVHKGGMLKATPEVHFSQSTKDRANKLRKETGVNYWEERGLVTRIEVDEVRGSHIQDLARKAGKSSSSANDGGEEEGSDATEQEQDPLAVMTQQVMRQQSAPPPAPRPKTAEEVHREHVAATKRSAAQSQANQQQQAQGKRSTGPSQEELKRQREREEYLREKRKREEEMRKRQEYQQWKDQQNAKNAQLAAATAVTTVTFLAVMGKYIYQNMGMVDFDEIYEPSGSFSLATEFGYSFLVQPIYFNSHEFDGVDYDNNTNYDFTWPVNFDFTMKLGYEWEYVGGYAYGGAGLGMSLVAHSFNFPSYNYGGRIYAGLPNVKGLFEYGGGGRSITTDYWMFEEEHGGGYTNMSFQNIKYGARFTWGQFTRSHISLGIIEEGVSGGDGIRVQRIANDFSFEDNDRSITGYFLEYKKDHSFNFYLQVYPNYPFTGEVDYTISGDEAYRDGSLYFNVGFHRSIDSFMN